MCFEQRKACVYVVLSRLNAMLIAAPPITDAERQRALDGQNQSSSPLCRAAAIDCDVPPPEALC